MENNGNIAVGSKQPQKLNLKNDLIFKAFFGKKGNEKFLIDFLNGLLKIEIKEIEVKEEVNLLQLARDEKGGRLDIQAKLDNGSIVNIEMQMRDEKNIIERSTIYSSKVISKELKKGQHYEEIPKVIMINILNFNIFKYKEYVSESMLVLKNHREYEISELIKYYYIELPKYRETKTDMSDKLNQWLALIDDTDWGKIEMAEKNNKTIKSALDEMEYLTGDEEIQRLAELKEKWEMDWNSSMNNAKKEGEEEGERKEKIRTAKNLLKENVEVQIILKVTGLTKKEIEELKEQLLTEN